MKARGILPTNRPDDIPYEQWMTLLYGRNEVFVRAVQRLFVVAVVRPLRPWLRKAIR